MASLRYLIPFVFLALLPFGMWLGGAWTFAAAIAIPLSLTILDAGLGKDVRLSHLPAGPGLSSLPRIYVLLQVAITTLIVLWVAWGGATLAEVAGLVLSNGLTTGIFGMVAGHEMIHSRDRSDRALGLMFLASVFYMHFRISHIYGHHRRAATVDDPASARLGESLYAFLFRSVTGQFREAWNHEAKRRKSAGFPVLGLGNRMVRFLAIELLILIAVSLVSRVALGVIIANSVLAILLLETFNYVAHYGLSRKADDNGSLESLGVQHSWNSSNRMNNAALFNMGRHSDHHRHTTRHYPHLTRLDRAPELPSGYAGAMVTALVPNLWYRKMDERVMSLRVNL